MTPYYICYAILILSVAAGLLLDKLRVATILAFVPMFVLIAGRGMVGTDSAVYIQLFDVIRYQGIAASSFEPGFTLIVEILTWLFRDSFNILIFLGILTALIMLVAGMLLERSMVLFATIVLPYFIIDMSINGLRYGLAFAITALGAAALARGRLKLFIICGVAAASIQVTSVLLAASLWALMEARIRTFLAIAIALTVASVVFGDYVGGKISQNSDISGIGGVSGVAPLVATMTIIAALYFSDKNIPISKFSLIAVFMMQILSFLIARQYYAGLRLQGIFMSLIYLLVSANYYRKGAEIYLNKRFIFLMMISSLVLSASRLKNFNDDVGDLSPFNPYYFAAEI